MKIAWCIQGQPRLYKEGYKKIKEFMENNPDIEFDFFIHGWFHEKEVGQYYQFSCHRPITFNEFYIYPNTDQKIIDLYKPKSALFEERPSIDVQILFDSLLGESSDCNNTPEQFYNVLSNLKSVSQVNNLSRTYLKEHEDVHYDLVIHTRFDYLNDYIVDLKTVNPEKLSIMSKEAIKAYGLLPRQVVLKEVFVIGGLNIINHYSQAFYNVPHYVNDEKYKEYSFHYHSSYGVNPETMMFLNMRYCFPDTKTPLDIMDIRMDMLDFLP